MITIVQPHSKYKDSYISAAEEFIEENLWTELDLSYLRANFDSYVEEFLSHAEGKRLPLGCVKYTELWIIEDNEFVGRIALRHRLNDRLKRFGGHIGYEVRPSKRRRGLATKALEFVLNLCREKEIFEVLITCDDDNIASQKLIEHQGGILKDKIRNRERISLTRRYWIQLN